MDSNGMEVEYQLSHDETDGHITGKARPSGASSWGMVVDGGVPSAANADTIIWQEYEMSLGKCDNCDMCTIAARLPDMQSCEKCDLTKANRCTAVTVDGQSMVGDAVGSFKATVVERGAGGECTALKGTGELLGDVSVSFTGIRIRL